MKGSEKTNGLVCRETEEPQGSLGHLDWKVTDTPVLQWVSAYIYLQYIYIIIPLQHEWCNQFTPVSQGLPGPPGLIGEMGSDGVGLPGPKVKVQPTEKIVVLLFLFVLFLFFLYLYLFYKC